MADNPNTENAQISSDFNPMEIGRDSTMDIQSLLKANKNESQSDTESTSEKKKLSPLQAAKLEKENQGLGLVVENSDLEAANKPKTVGNKTEMDADKEVNDYMAEQDKLIEAARSINIKNKPQTPEEMVQLMDTIEDVAKTGVINKENTNIEVLMKTDEQKAADTEMREKMENSSEENGSIDGQNNMTPEETEARKKIITVLIDKTGLGGEFKFTEEEKEHIVSSSEIRVKEVEEINLSSLKILAPEKSFLDSVNEYQISGAFVPVVFPASRFRAYMTGLSYGEMGDIALSTENTNVDKLRKKLSVIYNKMRNPSCGEFSSFDEFLHKFSYYDIDIALYGLVVATFPEIDDIPLQCNNPKCKQSFNHKFSPRTLLRFDKCGNRFLSAMKETMECPISEFDDFIKNSPTKTHKLVKLPYSQFIVELGVASAYDYLYDMADNLIGTKFKDEHPNDLNDILQSNTALLSLVRSVMVPTSNGYMKFEKFEDIIQSLYHIKPEDIAILGNLIVKYNDEYKTHFALTSIKCPHCGTETEEIGMSVEELVFQKYQRLMSTDINIDSIAVL